MPDPAVTPTPPAVEKIPATKHRWLARLIVLLVAVLLMLPLLHKSAPITAMGPGAPGGPPGGPGGGANGAASVTVSTVKAGRMQIFLDALGTVTPQTTVNVYSQVSGRVLSVNYREGQIVKKGEILAEIDPRPTEAQLQQAEGTLMRDRAYLEQARRNLKRYRDALEEHAIAEQTASDQEATVRQYEGTVQNDEGSVQYYKVQLDYCHIVAPVGGRIGLRLIDAGNTIFSGSSTTMATITQVDPTTVVFSVAEDHLPMIQKQLRASKNGLTVDAYDRSQSAKLATGRLLSLDNQVDTSTGTLRLRALFRNAGGALFPNQFVNARLQVSTLEAARLVPTVAVQYNGQQAFIYVMKSDSTAALRNVTVVNSEGSETAVDGVSVGDSVVTSNFDRIQDGARVSIAAPGGIPGTGAPPNGAPQDKSGLPPGRSGTFGSPAAGSAPSGATPSEGGPSSAAKSGSTK